MGLADTVTKAYMKENTVFADAFNYLRRTRIEPSRMMRCKNTVMC